MWEARLPFLFKILPKAGLELTLTRCLNHLILSFLSRQENQKLHDQNDDLNGQILSLSLYEAKNLFATQTKAQSLAAEIDSASRDEVKGPVAISCS